MGVAVVRPVTGVLWPALEDLFGRGGASNGCWCTYWILGAGYRKRPRQENKQQLHSSVMEGPPPGLLALDDSGTALGWCRLTPRTELPWLNRRRDLAAIDDLGVWSLPCFYVRPGSRGEGVAAALIACAVEYAGNAGAPALEAYPVDTDVEGATRNTFSGTVGMFARAGFTVIARRSADRPIMRNFLDAAD